MSTEPKSPDQSGSEPEPAGDIFPAERLTLLQATLRSLQEAFSAPDDDDEAGTTTELNQNTADAVPTPSEPTP